MKHFLKSFANGLIISTIPAVLLANFDVPALVTGFVVVWVYATTMYFAVKEEKS